MQFHQFIQDGAGWVTKERVVVFENPFLEIQQVRLVSPARAEPVAWPVCHRKGCVAEAPRTGRVGFVMIWQERVPDRQGPSRIRLGSNCEAA